MDTISFRLSQLQVDALVAGVSILSSPWGFSVPIANDGRPTLPPLAGAPAMRLRPAGGCMYAVLEGQCLFESVGETVALTAGDVLFMTTSTTHQLRDGPKEQVVPIWQLAPPPTLPLPGAGALPGPPPGLRIEGGGRRTRLLQTVLFFQDDVSHTLPRLMMLGATDPQVPSWVAELVAALAVPEDRRSDGFAGLANRLVQALFLEAAQRVVGAAAPAGGRMPDPRLQTVAGMVEMNLDRAWTIADMAKLAGVSRTTFCERFAASFGLPPQRYLFERRMERAGHLLRTTDLSVKAVAIGVGYRSEAAFYAAFRACRTMTPLQFRERSRQPRYAFET